MTMHVHTLPKETQEKIGRLGSIVFPHPTYLPVLISLEFICSNYYNILKTLDF